MSGTTRYRRRGREYEHRVVAAGLVGRKLLPREHVHHVNEDKLDNRPENLAIFASNADHMLGHALEHGRPLTRPMRAIPVGPEHPAFSSSRPVSHGRLVPLVLLDTDDPTPLWEYRRSLPPAERARFDRLRPLLLAA